MYGINEMKRDSKRSMAEFRSKKFFASWKGMALMIAMLPFYLAAKNKKAISIVLATGLLTSTKIYA